VFHSPTSTPTLFLTVGLPGAGKTTVARKLEQRHTALRLTPDEWMIPLFNHNDANGKRDALEGRLIWVALRTLEIGSNVVLDFGCWSRDERSAIQWLTESVGAAYRIVYLEVDAKTQRERVHTRFLKTPEQTFEMTPEDLKRWREMFEVPDEAELNGTAAPPPPADFATWAAWASRRWPSITGPTRAGIN
jgi:predicted kinase